MDILGIFISIAYIFLIIFISSLLSKKHSELSRKVVHIGVCYWWIIVILFFNNMLLTCIVPALFCIINFISYKKDIFKSMERDDKKSLGTVYYAISCLALTLLSFLWFKNRLYAGIGLFAMGYGDGLAALAGTNFKSKKFVIFGNEKTIVGSITMFVASFIAISILALCFNQFSILGVLIVSAIATLIEAVSPFGLDNITVPILTSILAYFII